MNFCLIDSGRLVEKYAVHLEAACVIGRGILL